MFRKLPELQVVRIQPTVDTEERVRTRTHRAPRKTGRGTHGSELRRWRGRFVGTNRPARESAAATGRGGKLSRSIAPLY